MTTEPRLHNKYHRTAGPDAVYIGRGSPWGNPFAIGRDGDRDQVCDTFERWLHTQPALIARIRRDLAGRDLMCFCVPARCHGELVLLVANSPACEGCGSSTVQVAVDEGTGLCEHCRPCHRCGQVAATCGDSGCEPA